MEHIIGKFQRVGEDERLPVSQPSSSLYEFEIDQGKNLLDDTVEVPELKELDFKKELF